VICILHGYLLEGSGSNLWTRAVVQALCRAGRTVHLVCQEPHPEAHDFIAAAYLYEPGGKVAVLFEREVPTPGRCLLHKPRLGDTLPVYVADRYEEFARAVPMVELPDEAIEAYIETNRAVVERVVRDQEITAILANHAVLMSVVAERVAARTTSGVAAGAAAGAGLSYAIMPHGSAIEYAVKRDARFHALASGALDKAAKIFAVGAEMRRRVLGTFPTLPGLAAKLEDLPLGVDAGTFAPAERDQRPSRIATLGEALKPLARGKAPEASERLRGALAAAPDAGGLADLLERGRGYAEKCPDAGLEERLASVDWAGDEILLFVGRLIAAKGLQSLVAALPPILEARPRARLVVVGHGPQREVMEALLWALERGDGRLVRRVAAQGAALEGGPSAPYETLVRFFDRLESRGEWTRYLETAQGAIRPDRVIFTGYLTHRELKHLLPLADVAVVPSIVAEAGPLVFLEAMAAGCFPLGSYFAGTAERIDDAARELPPAVAALMKLSPDPDRTVGDIIEKVPAALALDGAHKDALRRLTVGRHDWTRIARRMAETLEGMAQDAQGRKPSTRIP
jgi:glycosyltransferase involved in cell wall biosynthesis